MEKFLKKRDQGFTLVEMIVVIVILAILIGVSANGYSKYIAQAKLSEDLQLVDRIKTAMIAAASDPRSALASDATANVSLSNTGELRINNESTLGGDSHFDKILAENLGLSKTSITDSSAEAKEFRLQYGTSVTLTLKPMKSLVDPNSTIGFKVVVTSQNGYPDKTFVTESAESGAWTGTE